MENGTNKQFTFVLSVNVTVVMAQQRWEKQNMQQGATLIIYSTQIDKVNRAELGPF